MMAFGLAISLPALPASASSNNVSRSVQPHSNTETMAATYGCKLFNGFIAVKLLFNGFPSDGSTNTVNPTITSLTGPPVSGGGSIFFQSASATADAVVYPNQTYHLSATWSNAGGSGGSIDGGNFAPVCGPPLPPCGTGKATTPIVGLAPSYSNGKVNGYWKVSSDGGVSPFGGAIFHNSEGGCTLNLPMIGVASTPTGGGYWLVASDGGIFAFGDAGFYGSMGATRLNRPVLGMASTPSNKGYWLVASDGGIFAFGDAGFYGSMGGSPLNKPVVGMVSSKDGMGYLLVASDGGVFSFGDSPFYGSTGGNPPHDPVVGVVADSDGGYWIVTSTGATTSFGGALNYG